MRFLYILKSPSIGGAELQLLHLATQLRDGHQIEPCFLFIGKRSKGELLEQLQAEKMPVLYHRLPFRDKNFFHSILFLRKLLVRHEIDGVISFLDTPSFLASIACRFTKRTKVHIWGIRNSAIGFKVGYWYSLAWNFADIVVSNSHEGKESFRQTFSRFYHRRKKIHVIFNGVDQRKEDILVKSSSDAIRLTMVANYKDQKDYHGLIEVFELLVTRPNGLVFELNILGRDTEAMNERLRSDYGESQVRIHGYSSKVREVLCKQTDVGVLLTHYEGQPNTILEYMAEGLPVVATDLPVIRQTLSTENHEFLAPVGDSQKLAEYIEKLAESEILRREIGACNRNKVISQFSLEKMADGYWELISTKLRSN